MVNFSFEDENGNEIEIYKEKSGVYRITIADEFSNKVGMELNYNILSKLLPRLEAISRVLLIKEACK